MISIYTSWAAPFNTTPASKKSPPMSIVAFRPYVRVTTDAKNVAISAAKYNDDVKSWRIWLSKSQYWFEFWSSSFWARTLGKNFAKKSLLDVTPPTSFSDQIHHLSTIYVLIIFLSHNKEVFWVMVELLIQFLNWQWFSYDIMSLTYTCIHIILQTYNICMYVCVFVDSYINTDTHVCLCLWCL